MDQPIEEQNNKTEAQDNDGHREVSWEQEALLRKLTCRDGDKNPKPFTKMSLTLHGTLLLARAGMPLREAVEYATTLALSGEYRGYCGRIVELMALVLGVSTFTAVLEKNKEMIDDVYETLQILSVQAAINVPLTREIAQFMIWADHLSEKEDRVLLLQMTIKALECSEEDLKKGPYPTCLAEKNKTVDVPTKQSADTPA